MRNKSEVIAKRRHQKQLHVTLTFESIRVSVKYLVQTTLFTPALDTKTKLVIITIWLSRNLRLRGNNYSQKKARILYLMFKKRMCWIFVRIASVRRFWQTKCKSYILWDNRKNAFLTFQSAHNSEFILMATSLATNTVVVTRVHCIRKSILIAICTFVIVQYLVFCMSSVVW